MLAFYHGFKYFPDVIAKGKIPGIHQAAFRRDKGKQWHRLDAVGIPQRVIAVHVCRKWQLCLLDKLLDILLEQQPWAGAVRNSRYTGDKLETFWRVILYNIPELVNLTAADRSGRSRNH